MEEDPFALLEAMTIAGFATSREQGYIDIVAIFSRDPAIENAIAQTRSRRFAGQECDGHGFRLLILSYAVGLERLHLWRRDGPTEFH